MADMFCLPVRVITSSIAETDEIIAGSILRREKVMKKIYFTITGTNYRYGHNFLKPGMKVKLEKEPDNQYDAEAIRVMMKGLGQIGYVANSTHTVKGESWSAGRIYDRIGKKAMGTVKIILPDGVLCKLEK